MSFSAVSDTYLSNNEKFLSPIYKADWKKSKVTSKAEVVPRRFYDPCSCGFNKSSYDVSEAKSVVVSRLIASMKEQSLLEQELKADLHNVVVKKFNDVIMKKNHNQDYASQIPMLYLDHLRSRAGLVPQAPVAAAHVEVTGVMNPQGRRDDPAKEPRMTAARLAFEESAKFTENMKPRARSPKPTIG